MRKKNLGGNRHIQQKRAIFLRAAICCAVTAMMEQRCAERMGALQIDHVSPLWLNL